MGATALAIGLTLASTAASAYNTQRTAKKQDQSAAQAIRNQAEQQRKADARVAQELAKAEGSTSAGEKKMTLEQYVQQLARNQKATEGSLNMTGLEALPGAFKEGAEQAKGEVGDYASRTAELMSRIDAPAYQRQREQFGYGGLGVDIGLIRRNAAGQGFIDDLRMRAIRRNPWIDAFSAAAGGAATAGFGGGGGSGSSGASPYGPYASGYQFPKG